MKRTLTLLAATCLIGSLAGCSKPAETSKGTADTSTKTTAADTTSQAPAPKDAADTTSQAPAPKDAAATATGAAPQTGADTTASLTGAPGDKQIDLAKLPDNMLICSVGGHPITVGAYRRMFKMQQLEMQNVITNDANARARLLQEAKKRGVALTADEKSKLLAMSKANKGSEAQFEKFLKERKLTEDQFNNEILDIGVAVKTSDQVLQQNMLSDLINRQLLADSARAAGMINKANEAYIEIKHSPTYQKLETATGFSADDLKSELIQTELAKSMMATIQKRAVVSPGDIQSFYNSNKKMFQHKERVRLSQIIVGAPSIDGNGVQSVKTQVQKANPKLTGKDLDNQVAATEQHQEQRAAELLQKAQAKGTDFAKLANEYTDDVPTKAAKIGGDIGWHERSQLIPQFADVVWPLKTGEVYSRLVRTPLGFHIVKVTGHEGAGAMTVNEVSGALKQLLTQQKANKVVGQWLTEKRRKATISLAPQFAALLTASMTKDAADAGGSNKTSSLNGTPH